MNKNCKARERKILPKYLSLSLMGLTVFFVHPQFYSLTVLFTHIPPINQALHTFLSNESLLEKRHEQPSVFTKLCVEVVKNAYSLGSHPRDSDSISSE